MEHSAKDRRAKQKRVFSVFGPRYMPGDIEKINYSICAVDRFRISILDANRELLREWKTEVRNEQAQHLDRGESLREAQMENTESPWEDESLKLFEYPDCQEINRFGMTFFQFAAALHFPVNLLHAILVESLQHKWKIIFVWPPGLLIYGDMLELQAIWWLWITRTPESCRLWVWYTVIPLFYFYWQA